MSGSQSYPPPGHSGEEPPPPPPGWQPPPPGWQSAPPTQPFPQPVGPTYPQPVGPTYPQPGAPTYPVPGMLGAAHKPGAIALRPLQLGDIYDAAFRIIRFNPQATVGSAVLVTAFAMLIPVVVTTILTYTVNLSLESGVDGLSTGEIAGFGATIASWVLGFVLQSLGLILVTGMIAHVTMAAAVGKKLTLGEAWAATKGKRLKLIGLMFLLGLTYLLVVALLAGIYIAAVYAIGTFSGGLLFTLFYAPVAFVAMAWFWIRIYYLPVPALMLEPVGIFGAIERGNGLSRGGFWRLFGIALLTWFVASVAGSLLGTPITLIMQGLFASGLDGQYDILALTLVNAVSTVVSAAFVAPFRSTVASLQYVDQRIRKEAFDVELMTRAGITAR